MKAVGASLALLTALAIAAFEVVGLYNPHGTKVADDARTFGPAAPWYAHLICILLIAFLVSAAVALLRRRRAAPDPDIEPDWGPSGGYDPGTHDPFNGSHH